MPPGGRGLSPRLLDLKIRRLVGARSRAPTGVIVFPLSGVSKGAQPFAAGGILPLCFLTFTQLSLVADDCKKLLVESMNAFLEPIRDRRKALTKTPSSSGTCSKPATPKPRPGLAESGCAQEKAELYLLEKAGRCLLAAGGSAPDPDLENDACWRAKPRANRRHCFPKRGFQRGSALCRRRHSSSLLLNVYATVACRRRLQKAPRRIHERLPRTHSRPAQGLDKDPKLVWDMLEAGNAKARARASRNLDALKKKLNFIF